MVGERTLVSIVLCVYAVSNAEMCCMIIKYSACLKTSVLPFILIFTDFGLQEQNHFTRAVEIYMQLLLSFSFRAEL